MDSCGLKRGNCCFIQLLIIVFFLFCADFIFAQPEPPINVRIYSRANDNRLIWAHNPNNPAGYVTNYQVCRSTFSGAEIPIATVGYTTGYYDSTAGYNYATEFFYTIRAVGNDALISADSEEVMRFLPIVNLTRTGIATHSLTDRFYASWNPYPGQWTDTYFRIRSQPAGGSSWGSTNFSNRQVVRYERVTDVPAGGPYYVEVLVGRPDWWGSPGNNRWVSYSSSLPFYIDIDIPFEDNSPATYFNNSPRRVMSDPVGSGVSPRLFQNAGGNFWRIRQPIRARPHVDQSYNCKLNAPCRVTVTVPAGQIAAGRAVAEARVADQYGNELDSVVTNETNDGTWVTSFNVHFIASQYYNSWDLYWIYWGNPSATQPAYSFSDNFTQTSQHEYSPWFSRKILRGQLEWYSTSNGYRLIPNPPSPADDDFGTRTLGFTFPFYDSATNTIYLSANGYISFQPHSNPLNTWAEFSGVNNNRFIAPFWSNLMVNDSVPPNSGLYYYRRDTGNQYRHREQFTWVANRFNALNEIYEFQAVLYRMGDIAFRYDTINFNGLWNIPSTSGDNPLNATTHHTAGISATDGSRWARIADSTRDNRITPLSAGIGVNPMHLFQSCHSWRFDTGYNDPTNACSMAGLTSVGHYDSRIFDGKSTDPTWGSLDYNISGGGAVDIYIRTDSDQNFADYAAGDLIAANLTAGSGTIPLTLPNDRYLQYRLVLKKANPADNPQVERIALGVGYIMIDEVTNEKNGRDVSQGQTFVATMTVTNHFTSPVDIQVASLTFSPATAIQSWSRTSPLPTNISAEASATISFSITVATNAGNLNNWTYVDGYAEAGNGAATLTSSAALVDSRYRIREKATLVITKAETPFDKVNKGQGGIPVELYLQNTSGYVGMDLAGASLTFTLGDYSWSPDLPTFLPTDTGLYAEYYNTDSSTNNFTGSPVVSRLDPQVDFYWGSGTPFAELTNNYYGARWMGYVIPQISQTYTFYCYCDDGVRLWVNGQLIIDSWQNSSSERSGTINLNAWTPTKIIMEFYERTGNARAQLRWSSMSVPKAIIPSALLRPAYFHSIQPGGEIAFPFTVAVLPDSPSGLAYISGTASGTNQWVSGLITESFSAVQPDSWIIQEPASLTVVDITNPEIVYRGQGNVEVEVEVFNHGEAEGLISSAPLYLSLGSYTSIIAGETMPVKVNGGESVKTKVLVSIAEDTATGTSIIDADVIGYDGNVGTPLAASGSANTSFWTILAEKILTYRDPSFYYPVDSFTRPESGGLKVYALAENLAPLKEFAIRWYDASGTEIVASTTIGFSNPLGELYSEWEINPQTKYGVYTCKITNPVDTFSPSQTSFRVVTSASVSASLSLPAKVSVGQTFNIEMLLDNAGGAGATGMVPSALSAGGVGVANLILGPTPASVEVAGHSLASTTWQYVAMSSGVFRISGNATGFDANSLEVVSTEIATSSDCLIQVPALVTINDLTATQTLVYRNQRNIEVLMTLENHGEADACIDLTQLLLSPGFGSYSIASPTIPAILNGNSIATYVISVDINSNAPIGWATMTGRIRYEDVNNPVTTTITNQTHSWEIQGTSLVCSRNSAFTGIQYTFDVGQTVYARASGLPLNTNFRMRFYDDFELYPPTGVGIGILTPLNSGVSGTISHSHDIPAASTKLNRWMVIVDDDLDNDPNTLGNIMVVQFFEVMAPATYTIELDLGGPDYYVGDTIEAKLTINNVSSWTTNLEHYLYYFNFQYLSGSQGNLVRGPLPPQGWFHLFSGASHTFVIPLEATADSGNGSCSIRLPANSWRRRDQNSYSYTWHNKVLNCNKPIRIFRKVINLASDVWDFGSVEPGDTSIDLISRVESLGNRSLDKVDFAKVRLRKTATETLSGTFLSIQPELPISLATAGSELLVSNFQIPFNQTSGVYIASMAIYDDQDFSNTLEVTEPHDIVLTRVTVPSVAKAVVSASEIDLGVIEPGGTSASFTIEYVGIGNQDLTDLKFSPLPNISYFPTIIGSFSYNGYGSSSIWIDVPAVTAPGIYYATGTLFDDIPGGAIDNFTIKYSVGTQSLALTPDFFQYGFGTPTFDLPSQLTGIENTGQIPLSNVTGEPLGFINTDQPGFVATDNIALHSPVSINAGMTSPASACVYVPGGTATGTYIATYTWFEDLNRNGLFDSFEPKDTGVASFVVRSFYRIYTLKPTEDFGGVEPGTSKLISVGFRNAGSLPISQVRFDIASLTDGTDFFDCANISVNPNISADVGPGELRYVDFIANVPAVHKLGVFKGKMYVYGDINTNGARDAGEPCKLANLRIEIGNQEISIVSPAVLNFNGVAASQTPPVFSSVKNTGTLTLSSVKVETTEFTPMAPGPVIASNAVVYSPNSLIGPLVLTQTKTVALAVNVPMGQPPGTYTATLWAWEDSNQDNIRNATEEASSTPIVLIVNYIKSLDLAPDTINFGIMARGDYNSISFLAQNTGNINLLDARWQKYPLVAGAATINESAIAIDPSPVGAMPAPPPGLPESQVSTISILIPNGVSDGLYSGAVVFYEDEFSPGADSYDVGEPKADLTVQVQLVTAFVNISPDPINFANVDPVGRTATVTFDVANSGMIKFKHLKYSLTSLINGVFSIPVSQISIAPATFSNLDPGNSQIGEISVDVSPVSLLPGLYSGTINFWDDRNDNNIQDAWESVSIADINLTVNNFGRLNILPATIDLGKIARGTHSAFIDIPFQNTGNIDLVGLNWIKSNLTQGINMIGIASIGITFAQPEPINPGSFATATVQIDKISADQELGGYGPNTQILTMGMGISDSVDFICEIIPGGPQGLNKGVIYQEIATTTFPVFPVTADYILSSYVCVASGSGKIGFLMTDEVGGKTGYIGVSINNVGVVTAIPATASVGITGSFVGNQGGVTNNFSWYRIYVRFPYSYNALTASKTYLLLENDSADGSGKAVWFDGVKFEESFSQQARPTSYHTGNILTSPSRSQALSGEDFYYQW